MFRQVMGIIFIAIVLIVMAVLLPVANGLLDVNRDSSSGGYNCASYAGANPYNSSLDTNTLGCAVVPLVTPITILFVMLGGIALIIYGRSPQEQY